MINNSNELAHSGIDAFVGKRESELITLQN